jgi:glycoprotease/Kae1 family metallohydrolase
MYYLAIESSCDETSLAILEFTLPIHPHPASPAGEESNPEHGKFDILCEDLKLNETNFYAKINQIQVVSSIISSQIETHSQYGGVVPEVGARLHAEQIHGLFQIVLNEALEKLEIEKIKFYKQLETIFVTAEPGLMSALRVGIEFAKSLQFYIDKVYKQQVKLEFINHLQGHVASCFYQLNQKENHKLINSKEAEVGNSPREGWQLQADGVLQGEATDSGELKFSTTHQSNLSPSGTGSFASLKMTSYLDSKLFPHLHLMISGGNTQIRLLNSWIDWQIVGQTIDDAAGECFDKAARMVGIPYPGGATLSKIAGDQYSNPLGLPIAMLQSKDLNISLSGLKTAVRYKIQKAGISNLILDEPLTSQEIEMLKTEDEFIDNFKLQFIKQICISTQYAIIEQIVRKIDLAIKQYRPKSIGVSGGVSANRVLINKIQELKSVQNLEIPKVFAPDSSLTGDNAIMIGLAGII